MASGELSTSAVGSSFGEEKELYSIVIGIPMSFKLCVIILISFHRLKLINFSPSVLPEGEELWHSEKLYLLNVIANIY